MARSHSPPGFKRVNSPNKLVLVWRFNCQSDLELSEYLLSSLSPLMIWIADGWLVMSPKQNLICLKDLKPHPLAPIFNSIIITMTIIREKSTPIFNSIMTIYCQDDSIHKEVVIAMNLLINIIIMIFIATIFTTMTVMIILEKFEKRSCPTHHPPSKLACQ